MRSPISLACALFLAAASAAAPPSPKDLERWAIHERQRDARLERAEPWKSALAAALPAEADSTRDLLFLITYKHHVRDSGEPAPTGLGRKARAFSKTWNAILRDCTKAGIRSHDLAQAIYRFTNSDWSPVSGSRGPGLDQVAAPSDLQSWARAVLATAAKARKAGMDPAQVWLDQAESYGVSSPADIAKVGLKPAPRRH